jgi:glycosyltransferase involved in cell wall biosynthesis
MDPLELGSGPRRSRVIVQLEPPHSTRGGDWYYRTHAPGRALAECEGTYVIDAVNTHRERKALIEQADVLVLNMLCDVDLLPAIYARRSRGQITVYEWNDDVAFIQAWNPAATFYEQPGKIELLHRLAWACDGIQFSAFELARRYGHLNAHSCVLPNQVSLSPKRVPRIFGDSCVIGWGGSHGHLEDMAAIARALSDFANETAGVSLAIMGSKPIYELFAALPQSKKRFVPAGSIDDYYRFLSSIDVGLAPLENTGFNRCRSDVKFLEYAAHEVVPVVADLAPYRDTVRPNSTGFLFADTSEMLRVLRTLVAHPEERSRIGKAALSYVQTERRESDHAFHRLEFYDSLLRARSADRSSLGAPAQFFTSCTQWEGAEVRERHVQLNCSAFENKIHDGLILSRDPAQHSAARESFGAASALKRSHHPHLFAVPVSEAPLEELQKAIEVEPASAASYTLLAELLYAAGSVSGALTALQRVAELCPGYEAPYRKMAEVLESAGLGREAREFRAIATRLAAPIQPPEQIGLAEPAA